MIDRHLKRHAEKDAEAGGEGLGKLISRRKLWRPEAGYIKASDRKMIIPSDDIPDNTDNSSTSSSENEKFFTKRREYTLSSEYSRTADKDDPNLELASLNNDKSLALDDLGRPTDSLLYSTGSSEAKTVNLESGDQLPNGNDLSENQSEQNSSVSDRYSSSNMFYQNDQANIVHSSSDSHSISEDIILESFVPDTASSFTMPFTTLKDYSWIFENPDEFFSPKSTNNYISPVNIETANYFNNTHDTSPASNKNLTKQATPQKTDNDGVKNVSSLRREASDVYSNYESATDINPHLQDSYVIEFTENPVPFLPKLDETTRLRTIDFIVKITSTGISYSSFDKNDEFFEMKSMQKFLNMFFIKVNVAYPLIHCSSFNPNEVDSLLLVSLILLGASYDTKASHKAAVKIHDCLRGVLFSSSYFNATPDLWVLQAILLIEIFGKNKADIKQYEMACLFHGLLINLIRRSGCENAVNPPHSKEDEFDPEESWKTWIKSESMKRLALLTFLLDVQHATLFSQTLCMSAFELRAQLPSDAKLWNAKDAEEWLEYRRSEKQPLYFLITLKKYINCSDSLPHLNPLSRVLILHGLMGISWDMQRRDQTSLGLHIDPYAWKTKMAKAYDCWKDDFDKFSTIAISECANSGNSLSQRYLIKYLTTNNAIYHSAHIILWTNIIDLQIFAGAEHILGRPVNTSTFDFAKKSVISWSRSMGKSEKAVMHAAQLLREGLTNLDDWEVDGTFHYPWCLYLASLTCWAFFKTVNPNKPSFIKDNKANNCPPDLNESIDTLDDYKYKMRNFLLLVTSETPNRYRDLATHPHCDTTGMLNEIADYFRSIRWEIIYESLKVLKNIIGTKGVEYI
ncbi:hypothetical protein PACTADRAFT_50931 [Pachysolen tannophilus NRRL Y-2460]|uniref:Xylanolytic transcriptional activator regulatory domain-containing protein n=1 Tax=Pachysolen tannophilus NRRL Y-2460 TaxID=669874 RepID=A0A1E4TQJ7_PACTA|nr:hypothetical protein PACTADRAFT_50931 [Pachysolen tannophilus NRRL Y-2460]